MKKTLLRLLTQMALASALVLPSSYAAPTTSIDLVFVLDTTGSMNALIQSAKSKIWSIVNNIQSDSTPQYPIEVRVGLVAYRDRKDQYEVKMSLLNSDLDAIYADLMGYQAIGGGDFPEDVQQALHKAISELNWSPNETARKIVFLVGDAPPHRDYTDYPAVEDSTKTAVRQGIVVNAILMGNNEVTEKDWRSIATLGKGDFFKIPLDSQAQVIQTPYDDELRSLGDSVSSTYLPYGSQSERASVEASKSASGAVMQAAPAAIMADRAYNKAINAKSFDANTDLIQAIEEKRVVLAEVAVDSLPSNMQTMSLAEREEYVQQLITQRQTQKEKILELTKKREAFIQAERKKLNEPNDTFDHSVNQALKKQLKR